MRLQRLAIDLLVMMTVLAMTVQADGDVKCLTSWPGGVSTTCAPLVSDGGDALFVAPMQERSDSADNDFLALYRRSSDGIYTMLFPGYALDLAQALGKYSRTPVVKAAATPDFSRIAVLQEYIAVSSGTTAEGVVIPRTLGVMLVVADGSGRQLGRSIITAMSGSVSSSNCYISWSKDGRWLLLAGQYCGLRLYDMEASSETSAMSWKELDVPQYAGGQGVLSSDAANIIFPVTADGLTRLCSYEVVSGTVSETGFSYNASVIPVAQITLSADGQVLAFRSDLSSITIAKRSAIDDVAWQRYDVVSAPYAQRAALDANGQFVAYQRQDENTHTATVSVRDVEDGFDYRPDISSTMTCLWPTLSPSGGKLLFAGSMEGKVPQLYLAEDLGYLTDVQWQKGWQPMGFVFQMDDRSFDCLASAGKLYHYACGTWLKCTVAPQAGEAIWFYAESAGSASLSGKRHQITPMPLQPGLNFLMPSVYPDADISQLLFYDTASASWIRRITKDDDANAVAWYNCVTSGEYLNP